MSNIFLKKSNSNVKSNDLILINMNELGDHPENVKHFPPANKEWSNCVYNYNKNHMKSLPIYDENVTNLIKSYFNLYDPKNEKKSKKMSRRMRIRLKRLSINNILIGKTELKHTNSKVIITSDVFNAQERYLSSKLRNTNYIKLLEKNSIKLVLVQEKLRELNDKKLQLINKKSSINNETTSIIINNKLWFINNKQRKLKRVLKILNRSTSKTIMWLRRGNRIVSYLIKKINNYLNRQRIYNKHITRVLQYKLYNKYLSFAKKLTRKEKHIKRMYNLIHFHRSKFYKTELLNTLIGKIYNKNIQFNFINLKYLHLNSDILTQSIATKLKKRKNKPLRVLRNALGMIKLPSTNKYKSYDSNNVYKILSSDKTNSFYKSIFLSSKVSGYSTDIVSTLLKKLYFKQNPEKEIFNTLEHKVVNGIRIEAKGRLSKRLTAARSVYKVKYKGSLKNINSSFGGLPSVMLKGYARSNIQYTKKNSKTRNGSFGLKVWISSK